MSSQSDQHQEDLGKDLVSSVAGQRTEKGLSSTFQTLLGGQKVVDAARAVREDIASVD